MASDIIPYIHRDISWLDFNYRVLQEAKDKRVPLLERVKFLAIYSSNLDEFFRVRVANHRNITRAGKKARKEMDFGSNAILKHIHKIVNKQQEEFSRIFKDEIIPALKKENIYILRRKQLNAEQLEFIENYFQNHMLPYVQPVLLIKKKIKPFLNSGALYLALHIVDKDKKDPKPEYALANIPSNHLPRFLILPSDNDRKDIILLDDVVRHSVFKIFPGYHIKSMHSIKFTRDAELYIDDEFSGDLIEKLKKSLSKRNVGLASRMVYDRDIKKDFLQYIMDVFDLDQKDLLEEGRYHNNSDFFSFPTFELSHLKNEPLPPVHTPILENAASIFNVIKEKDYVVHVPYQSYEPVIKFFEDAAKDPTVTHIKITQYRVAKVSRIMDALIKASKAGKQVSTFIEIKARFDEEANLKWGEKLEKAGVKVHYSLPGLKVHSKVALIRRMEDNQPVLYSYLSTGNFNEDTAFVYSDLGILTADTRYTKETARLFLYLETRTKPKQEFKHLFVGQFKLKNKLKALVEKEISEAKKKRPAAITLKMNSLQDAEMIELLYKASQAGVKIKLIVRGICSIVPGIKGVSENIRAISIIDRFLEHSRIFIFENKGDELIYCSSADWMERNLHHRVETIFPIYDEDIRILIKKIIKFQWRDNVKARIISEKNQNTYQIGNDEIQYKSQLDTYFLIRRFVDNMDYTPEIDEDVEISS